MIDATSSQRASLFDRATAIIRGVLADNGLPVPVELKAGDRVGPYTIEKKLGMGGVGIVYLASQSSPIKRQVALKALKPGMDSMRILARFKVERTVLAPSSIRESRGSWMQACRKAAIPTTPWS